MDSIVPDSYPYTDDWNTGELVTLKAVPAPGYQFVDWSGSVSGSDESISVEMTCNKSVTANFAVISYTLTAEVGPGAGGEVIVEPSQSGGGYAAGSEVTVTAVPGNGYSFSHWSGAISGSKNPVNVIMDSNKELTANFTVIGYTLAADVGPGAGGEVVVEPSQSGGGYAAGSEVTVTAVPGNGYAFSHWSGAISGSKNPVNVIMDSNKELTANFTEATSFVWVWVASGVIAIGLLAYFLGIRRPRTT